MQQDRSSEASDDGPRLDCCCDGGNGGRLLCLLVFVDFRSLDWNHNCRQEEKQLGGGTCFAAIEREILVLECLER